MCLVASSPLASLQSWLTFSRNLWEPHHGKSNVGRTFQGEPVVQGVADLPNRPVHLGNAILPKYVDLLGKDGELAQVDSRRPDRDDDGERMDAARGVPPDC